MSRSHHSGQISLREYKYVYIWSTYDTCEKRHSIRTVASYTIHRHQNVRTLNDYRGRVYACTYTERAQHWRRPRRHSSTAMTATAAATTIKSTHNNHRFKFSSYADNRFVLLFPLFRDCFYYRKFKYVCTVRFSFVSHTLPRSTRTQHRIAFIEWNVECCCTTAQFTISAFAFILFSISARLAQCHMHYLLAIGSCQTESF